MDKPIQDALAIAKQAQSDINEILADPLHVNNRLTLNGFFDRIFKRLEFMGAFLEPQHVQLPTQRFGPIKKFMGKDIVRAQVVTDKHLNPKQAEINILKSKVERLYAEFDALGHAAVLRSYTSPEDVRVVRGVAKYAGVANYENAQMNVDFMKAISEGIKRVEELKAIERKLPTDNDDSDEIIDEPSNAITLPIGDVVKNKGHENIKGKK